MIDANELTLAQEALAALGMLVVVGGIFALSWWTLRNDPTGR